MQRANGAFLDYVPNFLSNQTIAKRFKKENCDTETDNNEGSDTPLGDSEDDSVEARADSDKAGQGTAPITDPTLTAPLEGLFQAGLLPALPFSEPSPTDSSTSGGEDEFESLISRRRGRKGRTRRGGDSWLSHSRR
ncbi:hypothetical protein ACFX2I_021704 [Malus domestica]